MPAPLSQRLHKGTPAHTPMPPHPNPTVPHPTSSTPPPTALALLLLLLGPAAVLAFSFSSYLHPTRARTPQQCSPTALAASMQQPQQQQQPQKTTTTKAAVGAASRRDWLLAQSVSVFVPASLGLLGLTGAAGAAADPAKAGTKDDPAYQVPGCGFVCGWGCRVVGKGLEAGDDGHVLIMSTPTNHFVQKCLSNHTH